MPLTSPELVRAHLSGFRAGEMMITDTAATLSGTQPVQLPHAGLVANSVVVKALRLGSPVAESIAPANDWINLSYTRLVPDSVLVAADTSLGVIFVENIDYVVDAAGGRIKRIGGGAIAQGQTVSIWYDHYYTYTAGDDYTVDEANGRLSRVAGGTIADGQTVLVDYNVSLGTVSDSVIDNAIMEASEAVMALIDPRYHDEPSTGIIIGETHWAVAAVCRMQAAATLAETTSTSAAIRSAAQAWLELADRYEQSGRDRLARFAAPVSRKRSAKRN